jgi:hypothetical protein
MPLGDAMLAWNGRDLLALVMRREDIFSNLERVSRHLFIS